MAIQDLRNFFMNYRGSGVLARRGNYTRRANYAQGNRINRAARVGLSRLARNRINIYQRRRTRTSGGVLGGSIADVKRIYRRKRMPRRRRKRWVAFTKKVHAVSEKELGARTVLFNSDLYCNENRAGKQLCLTTALYGISTNLISNKDWMQDVRKVVELENTLDQTVGLGDTIYPSTKFLFQSGVYDITIRNVSFLLTNNGTTLDSQACLELDWYDVMVSKEWANGAVSFTTFSAVLNNYDDPEIGGTGTGIAIEDRGATPFEFGKQMGMFGCKILGKTKYFIPNGQTITKQVRDPTRHVSSKQELVDHDSVVKKGWTKCFFIVAKLVPGLAVGPNIGEYTQAISVGLTRKYMYKIEGVTEARERLITASHSPGNPT